MKTVILAGGFGSRLAEETGINPKPLVEVGGKPLLWHIMKHYARHGFKEFFIALGYRGEMIKRYFSDYQALSGDLVVDLSNGVVERNGGPDEDWLVHLVDTGHNVLTGGRIKRLKRWLGRDAFMATYGDGVSDIDLHALLDFHRAHGCIATTTAVRPPARFGGIVFDGARVKEFTEKPQIGEGWINGGFMVFEPQVFEYLEDDNTSLEKHALERLAADGQLTAYRHEGFWQCMDTLRDKNLLEQLWRNGEAPWRTWS